MGKAVKILLELLGACGVYPHDGAAGFKLRLHPGGPQLGEDGAAGTLLVRWCHGVLKVQDDGVRPGSGLLVALGPVGGAEQQGRAHYESHTGIVSCPLRG